MRGVDLNSVIVNSQHSFWNGRRFVEADVLSVKGSGIVEGRYPDGTTFASIPEKGDLVIVSYDELASYKLKMIRIPAAYPLLIGVQNFNGPDKKYVVADRDELRRVVRSLMHYVIDTNVEAEELVAA